jgi:hypothetical protein
MPVVFMFGGLGSVLAGVTGELTSPRPGTLRLFTNVITPTPEDDATGYVECALSGYSPVEFRDMAWVTKTQNGAVKKTTETLTYTFPSYSGPEVTVYGSYVTIDGAYPAVLYADLFPVPFRVPLGGGAFTVDVRLSLRQLAQ